MASFGAGDNPYEGEEVAQNLSDPHVILSCVAEADAQIRTLRKQREKLLMQYQERMAGIEQHYHSVMNSEPSETGYDMPQPETAKAIFNKGW